MGDVWEVDFKHVTSKCRVSQVVISRIGRSQEDEDPWSVCVGVGGCWLFGISGQGWRTAKVTFEQGLKEVRVRAIWTPGRELLSERP